MQTKNILHVERRRSNIYEDGNKKVDFRIGGDIIITDRRCRKVNMNLIADNYFQQRFAMFMRKHIKNIGARFPKVHEILSIVYVKQDKPLNNLCSCVNKNEHFVQHLYKVVIKNDSVPLYLGERCFLQHGFPLSLCRAIEKSRRIIQNDLSSVVSLNAEELGTAIQICHDTAEVIIQNKYVPGLFFLQDFGAIINDLFARKMSLPPWLAYMLGLLARASIQNLATTQEERKAANRERYKNIYEFLLKIHTMLYGRSPFVRDMLDLIDSGDSLTPQQENAIISISKKYDESLMQKTEAAFPFLFALSHGKIPLLDKDATIFPGQTQSIFVSMYKQIEKGNHLTVKQVDLLRKKYHVYKGQYLTLPHYERMTNAELVAKYASLQLDDAAKNDIERIFGERAIPVTYINTLLETT